MIKKSLLGYYIVLVLILVSWSNPTTLPPTPLRLIYLLLVVIPLFFKIREMFFVVFFFFVILSGSNHAVSFMPATGPSLVICALIGALFFKPSNTKRLSLPISLSLLAVLVVFNDIITCGKLSSLFYSLLLTIIVSHFYISYNNDEQLEAARFSFVLLSIILSIEFFIWGSQFSRTIVVSDQDFERLGWSDPNYFSCLLGFGTLLSYEELLSNRKNDKKHSYFYLLSIVLSLYVIIATASRGAVLALLVAAALVTLLSEKSFKGKIAIVFGGLFVFLLFYKLGYFDLLFGRFAADDGTAGDRTVIWATKLKVFFKEGGLSLLFGHGIVEGRWLGFDKAQGFHNDYVAFLVCYGIFGLAFFLHVLLYPIFSHKTNKRVAIPFIAYLAMVCISLEPISSGSLIYFYFYMYVIAVH